MSPTCSIIPKGRALETSVVVCPTRTLPQQFWRILASGLSISPSCNTRHPLLALLLIAAAGCSSVTEPARRPDHTPLPVRHTPPGPLHLLPLRILCCRRQQSRRFTGCRRVWSAKPIWPLTFNSNTALGLPRKVWWGSSRRKVCWWSSSGWGCRGCLGIGSGLRAIRRCSAPGSGGSCIGSRGSV